MSLKKKFKPGDVVVIHKAKKYWICLDETDQFVGNIGLIHGYHWINNEAVKVRAMKNNRCVLTWIFHPSELEKIGEL